MGYILGMQIPEAEATKVGARLRWFREYYGLSNAQFAKKLGIRQSQLSDWENGVSRLSINGALKIYDQFKVGPDFFFLEVTAQLPQALAQAWHSRNPE